MAKYITYQEGTHFEALMKSVLVAHPRIAQAHSSWIQSCLCSSVHGMSVFHRKIIVNSKKKDPPKFKTEPTCLGLLISVVSDQMPEGLV